MAKGNSPTDSITIDAASTPAVAAMHEQEANSEQGIYTASRGVRLRIEPVSPNLVDDITARIPLPPIPMWMNEEKGREEPNENDPLYVRALNDVTRRRGTEAVNAMILLGVTLVDGMPADKRWLARLRYAGIDVDESDEIACELAYIRYIALASPTDLTEVVKRVGLSQEAIQAAADTFQRPAQRRKD